MGTDAISHTTSDVSLQGSGTRSAQMGKEDFLKLLVAQLSHQDPLKPTDGAQFVAELAQFSKLEHAIGAKAQLRAIAGTTASARDGQAFGLIGKTVTVSTRSVEVGSFGAANLRFSLGAASEQTQVTVTNEFGTVVRKFDAGALPGGMQDLAWDGHGSDSQPLPAGNYQVSITAKSAAGTPVTATLESTNVVTGVVYANGQTLLDVGGARAPLSSVTAVK